MGFFALVSCMRREVKQLWHIKISQPYIARETAEVSARRNSRPKEVVYFYHGQRRQIMLVWSGLYKCKLYWSAIRPGKGLYVNAPKDHSGAVGLKISAVCTEEDKPGESVKCICFVGNCGVQGEKLIFRSDYMELLGRRIEGGLLHLSLKSRRFWRGRYNIFS